MARHRFGVAEARRWMRAAVALVGVAVVMTAAPAVADGGHVSEALGLVNASRSAGGHPPVSLDPRLSSIAHGWAATLAQRDELVHNARLPAALEGALGSGWVSAGENLGRGPNITSIHDGFLASASHRAVLLDPAYTLVGIAVVPNGQRLLTVHVFVQPAAPAPAAATPAADPPGAAPPVPRSAGDTAAAPRPVVHPLSALAATNRAPVTQVRDDVPGLRTRALSAARAGRFGPPPRVAVAPDRSRAAPVSLLLWSFAGLVVVTAAGAAARGVRRASEPDRDAGEDGSGDRDFVRPVPILIDLTLLEDSSEVLAGATGSWRAGTDRTT